MPDDTPLPNHYFVTFSNGSQTGSTEVRTRLPIRGMADVIQMQDSIRRDVPGAVVLGWQRFES